MLFELPELCVRQHSIVAEEGRNQDEASVHDVNDVSKMKELHTPRDGMNVKESCRSRTPTKN